MTHPRPTMKLSSRAWSGVPLLLVCTLYLVLACVYLREPGLQYDEVLFANAALGNKDGSFIAYQISVGDVKIPLMLMSYIGAVKASAYAPILAVFPAAAVTVRLPAILAGLLALIAAYLFVGHVFDRRVALIAALLLATDPSYIYHIRLDWGPVALMLLLKTAALYCLVRFAKTGRVPLLAAGAFLLGLGLYDKAIFAWFLAALLLAALVVWRKRCRQWVTRRNVLIVALFFFLGCWPLLLYNAVTRGGSFAGQLSLPMNVLGSIQNKTHVLLSTLDGTAVFSYVNGDVPGALFPTADTIAGGGLSSKLVSAVDTPRTLMPEILLGCMAALGCLLFAYRIENAQTSTFLLLVALIIQLQIYITPHATGPHHVMMLYPFPQIVVAFVCSTLVGRMWSSPARCKKLRRTVSYAAIGALVVLVASNVIVDAKYLRSFSREGGHGIWSNAIYDLADFAQENPRYCYVLMDWGFNTQMLLLSHGTIDKEEVFWSLLETGRQVELADWLYRRWMANPASAFVFHAPKYTQFDQPKRVFDAMLERYGLKEELLKVFRQRNGDPVYLVYEVSRPVSVADMARGAGR